jgi:Ca2+-binding EF-hand superfamily protein
MNTRMFLLSAAIATFAPAATAANPPAGTAAADTRVDATFAAWDTNKDHQLSLAEFKAGWAELQKASAAEAALIRQFQSMDTDHNGALDANEYANLLLVKRAGKAAPPLSAFDANKDQRLEFGEYVALVRKLGAQPAATRAPAP